MQLEVGVDPAEVGRARRWARSRLVGSGIGADEPVAETLLLLISELVTNAVVHTGCPAVLRMLFPAAPAAPVRVEVADTSDDSARHRGTPTATRPVAAVWNSSTVSPTAGAGTPKARASRSGARSTAPPPRGPGRPGAVRLAPGRFRCFGPGLRSGPSYGTCGGTRTVTHPAPPGGAAASTLRSRTPPPARSGPPRGRWTPATDGPARPVADVSHAPGAQPDLVAEPPRERAYAHRLALGELPQRDRLVQPLQRPRAGPARCWPTGGSGSGRRDVLRLTALPVRRHHVRRATPFATAAPKSRRTMCRHRSMPAATPAEVSTSPSSTYSTSGSTFTRGKSRWKRSGWSSAWSPGGRPAGPPRRAGTRPCRSTRPARPAGPPRRPRPVPESAGPRRRPRPSRATRHHDRVGLRPAPPGRDPTTIGKSASVRTGPGAGCTSPPRTSPSRRSAVRRGAEDPQGDAEFERDHPVEHEHRDPVPPIAAEDPSPRLRRRPRGHPCVCHGPILSHHGHQASRRRGTLRGH